MYRRSPWTFLCLCTIGVFLVVFGFNLFMSDDNSYLFTRDDNAPTDDISMNGDGNHLRMSKMVHGKQASYQAESMDMYKPQQQQQQQQQQSHINRKDGIPLLNTNETLRIYNVNVGLLVNDIDRTLKRIQTMTSLTHGAFIQSMSHDANYNTASITLRVPVDVYEQFVDKVKGIVVGDTKDTIGERIVYENMHSEDVTDQVIDVEAQWRNVAATHSKLLELLDKAQNVQDTLSVQRELLHVTNQIESNKARSERLRNQAALTSISVSLSTHPVRPLDNILHWGTPRPLKNAQYAIAFLSRMAAALVDAAAFLGVVAVVLLPIIAVLYAFIAPCLYQFGILSKRNTEFSDSVKS